MRKFKKLSVRDFTHQLGKTLLEGGDVLIYRGKDPYRYINIKEVKVIRTEVISDEEAKERQKNSEESGQEEVTRAEAALGVSAGLTS